MEHDPLKHEGSDKSDARFGCECTHVSAGQSSKYLSLGAAKGVPWVRYYPQDWLSKLASVAASSELAHRRLADLVWAGGEWPPSDPEILAQARRASPRPFPPFSKTWPSWAGSARVAASRTPRRPGAQRTPQRRSTPEGTGQAAAPQ